MLDMIEDHMALRSIPYARLDGGTTRPRRALDIRLVRPSSVIASDGILTSRIVPAGEISYVSTR